MKKAKEREQNRTEERRGEKSRENKEEEEEEEEEELTLGQKEKRKLFQVFNCAYGCLLKQGSLEISSVHI